MIRGRVRSTLLFLVGIVIVSILRLKLAVWEGPWGGFVCILERPTGKKIEENMDGTGTLPTSARTIFNFPMLRAELAVLEGPGGQFTRVLERPANPKIDKNMDGTGTLFASARTIANFLHFAGQVGCLGRPWGACGIGTAENHL